MRQAGGVSTSGFFQSGPTVQAVRKKRAIRTSPPRRRGPHFVLFKRGSRLRGNDGPSVPLVIPALRVSAGRHRAARGVRLVATEALARRLEDPEEERHEEDRNQ